uniref:Uncharacterized protein n=1 Tax=Hyaloperonospora arabidopsidis (strain Emoy2) TaxID=559515 RepID=M4BQY8_HYAAE
MRIDVASTEHHIRDQRYAAGENLDRLGAEDQKAFTKEITTYAATLVTDLMSVKAERGLNNLTLENDAPHIVPQQLVNLHPSTFIQDVLNTYRARLNKFWMPEQVEELEADHRDLIKTNGGDVAVRDAIDNHEAHKLFNEECDCYPLFKRLCAFCGGFATIFPNTTSVESDFLILKWELDKRRTALMHLSLAGSF